VGHGWIPPYPVVAFTEKRTLGNGRFASSHHLYQRLPWRKHFADLYGWHSGTLESIEQGSSISAGNGEQQPAGGLGIEKNGPDFCRDALTIADHAFREVAVIVEASAIDN
jgi:hypothetical protein